MAQGRVRLGSRISRRVIWRVPYGFWAGLRLRGNLRLLLPTRLTPEQRFLRGYSFAGKECVDAGGFNGRLAWYFARDARKVVTFEPNPFNQATIRELSRLNRTTNLTLIPLGLGAEVGEAEIVTHGGTDATGTFDHQIAASFADSCAYVVGVTTLDQYCADAAFRPAFVKVDVEGYEMQVLQGAETTVATHHPDFFVEIHGATQPAKMECVRGVVAWLLHRGYRCTHVESGRNVGLAESCEFSEGHVFAWYATS